jgi:hypothetical protein
MTGYGLGSFGYADPRVCSSHQLGEIIGETDDSQLEGLDDGTAEVLEDAELAALAEVYPEYDSAEGMGFLKKIGKAIKRNTSSILKGVALVAPVLGPVGMVAGAVAGGIAANRDAKRAQADYNAQVAAEQAAQQRAAQASANVGPVAQGGTSGSSSSGGTGGTGGISPMVWVGGLAAVGLIGFAALAKRR